MQGMNARARSLTASSLLFASLATVAAAAPTAAADGLPVGNIDAAPVSAPGSDVAYLTRRAGRDTALVRLERRGERVLRRVLLDGRWSVPAVAYDGSPSGLAADGRTLVLINPRRSTPREVTPVAIVDPATMRIRRRLRLDGDFSFDALSPDGRLMYLIEYLSPRNYSRYAVRAYDLRRRRLLPEPIVDPREPDERMSGWPMTRATSADGRWEYTLYQGTSYPFIHALDTERRRAFCIDLDGLGGPRRSVNGMKLRLEGASLVLLAGARPMARVETRTLRVSEPRTEGRPKRAGDARAKVPWALVLVPTGLVVAAAGAAFARRRSGMGRAA